MGRSIPAHHPLRQLFATVTERCFLEGLGWPDLKVIRYVAELLLDFTHIDSVYKIRNAQGRRFEDVVEMLMEGDLLHRARSVDREREVHKHIGDYTLFMSGLFPEFLRRMKRARVLTSPDALLDYVQTGKRSYRLTSEFSYSGHGEEASLFRKLSENFELCVYGLGYVRADLDRLRNPMLQRIWGTLLS
ncbi:MAG: hypothetical protein ACE5I9_03035 [Candidatus Methylomirabilales bacterium]